MIELKRKYVMNIIINNVWFHPTIIINYIRMKKSIVILSSLLFSCFQLSGQAYEPVTVSAGTPVLKYFPLEERYRYPDFKDGQINYKNGSVSKGRFNYNFLKGDIDFIQLNDTLSLVTRREMSFLTIGSDTFYFDNGYIEQISGGNLIVGVKQFVKLKDVLKKGAFGTTNRHSAIESYIPVTRGGFQDWIPNEDTVFQMEREYYFSNNGNIFVLFTRKRTLEMFPWHKDKIQSYLKSNKINFSSEDDLLRLAEFLRSLS